MSERRFYGGHANLHLDAALEHLHCGKLLHGLRYCMITSLDSDTDIERLVRADTPFGRMLSSVPEHSFCEHAFVIPLEALFHSAIPEGWFVGFDELWFFGNRPQHAPPPDVSIVPPSYEDSLLDGDLRTWMHVADCTLAMATGEGLIFATTSRAIVEALLEIGAALLVE